MESITKDVVWTDGEWYDGQALRELGTGAAERGVGVRMNRIGIIAASLACMLGTGCMDGPFFALKKINPIYRAEWKRDQAWGPTFDDRLAELDRLEKSLKGMPPERQEFWAQQLALLIQEDPSPVLRARATALISRIPSPMIIESLNRASTDESLRVRLAAVDAWKRVANKDAENMLLSMAVADDDSSVRQASIEALQQFRSADVVRSLAQLLDDPSPAIQRSTTRTLAAITGEPLEADVDAWKQYIVKNFGAGAPNGSQPPHGMTVQPASTRSP
ncbi:MAG: hypothetical protein KatS3mg111_0149 [Pirellulaceae bacterium]|nr:MAG: hypothetical protein KatS3mg111_0149 [Pirellulaceae bacterium]